MSVSVERLTGDMPLYESTYRDPVFRLDRNAIILNNFEQPMSPGISQIGIANGSENGDFRKLPIVAFTYCKRRPDGTYEKDQRVVLVTGKGYGVHRDHVGQAPCDYIVGAELGRRNPETEVIEWVDGLSVQYNSEAPAEGVSPVVELGVKNFSTDCVVGCRPTPVVANLPKFDLLPMEVIGERVAGPFGQVFLTAQDGSVRPFFANLK